MDTALAIETRRSIRHYDTSHTMDLKDEQKLIELAMLSPSSFNIQNWRFVVVRDQEKKKEIRKIAWDQEHITDSSMLVVITADLQAWNKDTDRYWKTAPTDMAEMLVGMTKEFYKGKDQLQRDEAMRSAGISAQTLMLAATSMGYESCPMIGFDPDELAKIINLPEDHVIGMIVAIGKKSADAYPRGGQLPIDEVRIVDSF